MDMGDDVDRDEVADVEKILEELRGELRELEEGREVPLPELFPPEFMQRHTDASDIEEFLLESDLFSPEDIVGGRFNCTFCETGFDSPGEAFDSTGFTRYVEEHSTFSSWQEMLDVAAREWLHRKLSPRR